MIEYHSDFWVVVGAAAPVLALAHAVTFERFFAMSLRSGQLKTAVQARVPRTQKRKSRLLIWLVVAAPGRLSMVGMLASVSALVIALLALADTNDNAGLGLAQILMAISAIALLLQPLLGAFSRAAILEMRLNKIPGTEE